MDVRTVPVSAGTYCNISERQGGIHAHPSSNGTFSQGETVGVYLPSWIESSTIEI